MANEIVVKARDAAANTSEIIFPAAYSHGGFAQMRIAAAPLQELPPEALSVPDLYPDGVESYPQASNMGLDATWDHASEIEPSDLAE